MKKYIIITFLVIFIFLVQFSFMNFIGTLSLYLSPILISLIVISLLYGLRNSVIWAIACGFFLDLYSLQGFGLHIIVLFSTTILVHYFFRKFITNKTLYSFVVLSVVSTVFFFIILTLLSTIFYRLNISDFELLLGFKYISSIGLQIVFNTLIVSLVYLAISRFSDRLKSDIILKVKL